MTADIHYDPERHGWVVTRHADILEVLRDNKRISAANSIGIASFDELPREVTAVLGEGYPRFPGLIELDPPTHTRLRQVINLAFTPRRVAALENRVREVAQSLIAAFPREAPIEFMALFAQPLPMTIIGDLVGVPVEDGPYVQTLSNNFRILEAGLLAGRSLDEQMESARLFVEFQRYAERMVEARRGSDAFDDLTSAMMATEVEGESLTLDQLISMVIHLLFAGQETTVMLLGSMMLRLLSQRDLWLSIVNDTSLAPAAVEEALRYDAPVTYHMRRTKEPVTVAGVSIPPEADIHLMFDAANHDPAVFPSPEAFELDRPDASRHLSFGRGIHFCVGAPLARLEARIALEELAALRPNLRLKAGASVSYDPHVMLHSLAQLELEG